MKLKDILEKIENNEIEDGVMFVGGDFFYPLIVLDKNIYILNHLTRNFVLLPSSDIGRNMNNKFNFLKQVID